MQLTRTSYKTATHRCLKPTCTPQTYSVICQFYLKKVKVFQGSITGIRKHTNARTNPCETEVRERSPRPRRQPVGRHTQPCWQALRGSDAGRALSLVPRRRSPGAAGTRTSDHPDTADTGVRPVASTSTDTRRAGLKPEVLNWSLSRVQQGTPQCWCPGSPNQTQALLAWASLRAPSVAYDLTRCLQDFLRQKRGRCCPSAFHRGGTTVHPAGLSSLRSPSLRSSAGLNEPRPRWTLHPPREGAPDVLPRTTGLRPLSVAHLSAGLRDFFFNQITQRALEAEL